MSKPEPIYLKDYKPPQFSVEFLHLEFDLAPESTTVVSHMKLRRARGADPNAALVLDGVDLKLIDVELDGIQLLPEKGDYVVTEECLTLARVPDVFALSITVEINPKGNTCLNGIYQSNDIFCSQCESHGFRRITYFLDRPDVLTYFKVSITADKQRYPILLSNGNLVAQHDLKDGKHCAVWDDPSLKPCYLFALVGGDLDVLEDRFTTMSDRDVTVKIYVDKGKVHQAHHAMDSLKKSMRWDEQAYGREYDLDIYMIVAVSDFNFGAMENKGLNIFNSQYLLSNEKTATDEDLIYIEKIVAHEYFHNWSGNRVTLRDWFQISLKEGFTVFRDQGFTEAMQSKGPARISEVDIIRTRQFKEDSGPMAHPIRPASYIEMNNFYTVTVYNKGAEVIRMMQTLLGEKRFRQATDLYFERHDGKAVTTDDFVDAMEDASGLDLSQFRRWYWQAGTPTLTIVSEYDSKHNRFILCVQQSCPLSHGETDKDVFHIPLDVGLISMATGEQVRSTVNGQSKQSHVLSVKKAQERYVFENVDQEPTVSLLRGFSAPVIVNYDYSDRELLTLMQHDTDGFARWHAMQTYFKRIIFRSYESESSQRGAMLELDSDLLEVMQSILKEEHTDKKMLAQLLVLPSEMACLAVASGNDVVKLWHIREAIKMQLARALEDDFFACFSQHANGRPYVFEPSEVARRALANTCLQYLALCSSEKSLSAITHQYHESNNMTDTMAALAAVNQYHDYAHGKDSSYTMSKLLGALREELIAHFYESTCDEALLVNKWLALVASSPMSSTSSSITAIMGHDSYNAHNPNNVRALIGSYITNNTVNFHKSDGSGYVWLVEQLKTIDAYNPQLAARLMTPLVDFHLYDAGRQRLMLDAIKQLANRQTLSKDLYEICEKCIALDSEHN